MQAWHVARSVIRDVANTPADGGAVQIKFGAAVMMEAHGATIAATNAIAGGADYDEMRREKMTNALVMKLARKMRNAVAEDEERRLPAGILRRASEVSDARRGNVAIVGKTASARTKQLPGAHPMTALRGVVRHPAELYMCEASADKTIVRQIHDAVDLAAKQPHTDAVTAFAKKIMEHAMREDAGDAFKGFGRYVAMLSPLAAEFEPPASEYGSEMARRLAWIRSDSPKGMMALLAMRIRECQARSTPGTVGRDGDTASSDRQRQQSGAADSTECVADRSASELMRNAGLVPPQMPTMPAMPGDAAEAQRFGVPGTSWRGAAGS